MVLGKGVRYREVSAIKHVRYREVPLYWLLEKISVTVWVLSNKKGVAEQNQLLQGALEIISKQECV